MSSTLSFHTFQLQIIPYFGRFVVKLIITITFVIQMKLLIKFLRNQINLKIGKKSLFI